MKLLRLKADGFGCLRGEFRFDRERMTLVLDENERGKSTMLAAVQAALYGLDDDRRRERVLTPVERYRPWDGGSYRVELDVATGGFTYTVRRDFAESRVEVRNQHGEDLTEQFREGKEEYPVGKKLLGLAEADFERCALVRQGALSGFAPAEDRSRRDAGLQALLEGAVDTRGGDVSAAEALEALEQALRVYSCPELDTSLQVENALKRLEAKKGSLDIELGALEEDFRRIEAEATALAAADTELAAAREDITRLEQKRRTSQTAEWRHELAEHEARAAELVQLREEAARLEGTARLPRGLEAELRETVARLEEAQRNLELLAARRGEERARALASVNAELEAAGSFAAYSPEDADRGVALAAEIRRLIEEERRLREEAFRARERLAARGFDPQRIQALEKRFGVLDEGELQLLRDQHQLQLTFQTEVVDLERTRTDCSETLRDIDQQRSSRKLPGLFLGALGLGAALAGSVGLGLGSQGAVFGTLLAAGLLASAAGFVMLALAGRARGEERVEALKRLSQAQHRLNLLKEQRARAEVELDDLALRMSSRDRVDLLREWSEYARLMEENEPAVKGRERVAELQEARRRAEEEARALLRNAGGGEPTPEKLEETVQLVRRVLAMKEKQRELHTGEAGMPERESLTAKMEASRARAVELIGQAGLEYDSGRDWGWHVEQAAARLQGAERHRVVVEELIPRLERQLLPPEREAELRAQLAKAPPEPVEPKARESSILHEAALSDLRRKYEEAQLRHKELREKVGPRLDQYYARRPGLAEEIGRYALAIRRAERFKASVELARDTLQSVAAQTHQRWGSFVNQRAAELLGRIGVRVEQVRVGEDLDFSLRLPGGQQATRPRAELLLSAGARDQVYLAMRLALSEFLSKDEVRLPLLLDDPLITSDDVRALEAFRLIAEALSREHQIFYFTCHRARIDAFRAAEPGLFKHRVEVVDVRGAVAASAPE